MPGMTCLYVYYCYLNISCILLFIVTCLDTLRSGKISFVKRRIPGSKASYYTSQRIILQFR